MAKKSRLARRRSKAMSMRRIVDEIEALQGELRRQYRGKQMGARTQGTLQFLTSMQGLVSSFCFAVDEDSEFIVSEPPTAPTATTRRRRGR